MNTLLVIIIIVFVVLQIILFFKVWTMTNDVKKIREKYTGAEADFSEYILQGKKKEAYNLLVDNLYQHLYFFVNNSYSKEGFMKKAKKVIEEYQPHAALAGKALPEHLADPEKFYEKYQEVKHIVLREL